MEYLLPACCLRYNIPILPAGLGIIYHWPACYIGMEYLLPVFCLRYNIPLACLLQRHEISAACLLVEIYFNIGIMPATVLQPHSVECDHGLDLSLCLHYDDSDHNHSEGNDGDQVKTQ